MVSLAIWHKERSHMNPSVSIIMPSYNQAPYLRDAIESILAQNRSDVECIVVDAGSTDETRDILRNYEPKIKFLSCPGLKQSEVMNKGLEAAQGDIIGFLNADDLYCHDTCDAVIRFFNDHPNVDMVYGDCGVIDQDGLTMMTNHEIAFHKASYLFLAQFISYPTVFFRRQIFLRIGKFDTSLDHAMDYDYWLKIANSGTIAHINRTFARFRWHPQSKSVLYNREATRECQAIRIRHLGMSEKSIFTLIYCKFFWFLYKTRRVILKFILCKYRNSLPHPFAYYFWKKRSLSSKHLAGHVYSTSPHS